MSFIASEVTGSSIRVLEDNQGAVAQAEHIFSSARNEHIGETKVRELLRLRRIEVHIVPAVEHHTNLFTKALETVSFGAHRRFLMNYPHVE